MGSFRRGNIFFYDRNATGPSLAVIHLVLGITLISAQNDRATARRGKPFMKGGILCNYAEFSGSLLYFVNTGDEGHRARPFHTEGLKESAVPWATPDQFHQATRENSSMKQTSMHDVRFVLWGPCLCPLDPTLGTFVWPIAAPFPVYILHTMQAYSHYGDGYFHPLNLLNHSLCCNKFPSNKILLILYKKFKIKF